MATAGYHPSTKEFKANDYKFGIIVSEWNKPITESLLKGCLDTLKKHGADIPEDQIHWVPGSFELPMGARILASSDKYDALICLGCIIRGETSHDQYIAQAVANGLMQLSMASNIPCMFGVLTTNTEDQAKERSGGKHGNKGSEAALSAIQMAIMKKGIKKSGSSIGFK